MQNYNKLLSNQKANLGDDDCIFRNSIFAKNTPSSNECFCKSSTAL